MNSEWVTKRHHCEWPSDGDFRDVWRCGCGRSWMYLTPGLMMPWWTRPTTPQGTAETESEIDRG